jgi:hypothetical protein
MRDAEMGVRKNELAIMFGRRLISSGNLRAVNIELPEIIPTDPRGPLAGIVVNLKIDGFSAEYATPSSTPVENVLNWIRGEFEKAKRPKPMRPHRKPVSSTDYPD